MQQLQVEANEYSYSAAISAAEKGLGGSENVEIPGVEDWPKKTGDVFRAFFDQQFHMFEIKHQPRLGSFFFK